MRLKNKPRVSQKEIAQRLGLSPSTISLALAGDPRLPLTTRNRILKAARKLGYTPDPMLGALAAYRKSKKPTTFQETLAWVTNHPTRDDWKNLSTTRYFSGAQQRATELGFKLEEFWLREPGLDPKRASSILLARGIRGLLIAPQPNPRVQLKMEWARFSSIGIGYTLASPLISLVTPDYFNGMIQAAESLRARGYRRIGFALDPIRNERMNRLWSGGFFSAQQSWAPEECLPPYLPRTLEAGDFLHWFNTHRPDAIISLHPTPLQWLQSDGTTSARLIGYATLVRWRNHPKISCIDQNEEEIGKTATSQLIRQIQHQELGIPKHPTTILIRGTWIPGSTATGKSRRES